MEHSVSLFWSTIPKYAGSLQVAELRSSQYMTATALCSYKSTVRLPETNMLQYPMYGRTV
jgi:hypothetical protein